jgi:hypothetical protein
MLLAANNKLYTKVFLNGTTFMDNVAKNIAGINVAMIVMLADAIANIIPMINLLYLILEYKVSTINRIGKYKKSDILKEIIPIIIQIINISNNSLVFDLYKLKSISIIPTASDTILIRSIIVAIFSLPLHNFLNTNKMNYH